jgi:uncharacterized protein YlxW (UPF0749 family)
MPPPPPPKQGFSTFTFILILALVVVGVAWWRGWLSWEKNPETGKSGPVVHKDAFKADKEAFLKSTGEAYTKLKDKITGKEAAVKTAKPEDKATLEKELEDLKKQRDAIDAAIKKAEAATDAAGLKLDDSIKKLLDNPK